MLRMVTRLDGDSWEGFAGFENYFDRNMKPLHLPTEVCYGVDVKRYGPPILGHWL